MSEDDEPLDWSTVPDPITVDYLSNSYIGDMKQLEAGMNDKMTPTQRASFVQARDEVLAPVIKVVSDATKRFRLPPAEWIFGRPSTTTKALMNSIDAQSNIISNERLNSAGRSIAESRKADHDLTLQMAESMGILAARSEQQFLASQRQSALGWIISVAVLFEVANSAVDNHTFGTELIALGGALLVVGLAWVVGRFLTRSSRQRN